MISGFVDFIMNLTKSSLKSLKGTLSAVGLDVPRFEFVGKVQDLLKKFASLFNPPRMFGKLQEGGARMREQLTALLTKAVPLLPWVVGLFTVYKVARMRGLLPRILPARYSRNNRQLAIRSRTGSNDTDTDSKFAMSVQRRLDESNFDRDWNTRNQD